MDAGKEAAEAAMLEARNLGGDLTFSGFIAANLQPTENMILLSMNGAELLKFSSDLLTAASAGPEDIKSYLNSVPPVGLGCSMNAQFAQHYLGGAWKSHPCIMRRELRSYPRVSTSTS